MQAALSVSKCALLFGIPITREGFERSAKLGAQSDYMTGMLRGMNPALVWVEEYERVARAAQQLVSTARDLGARVYETATLSDFAAATNCFQYVVLFAHWRGAMFRQSDITGDIAAIFERMDQARLLSNIRSKRRDPDALVDALNEAIAEMTVLDQLPGAIAETGRRTRALGQTLCRDLLDELLFGLTLPGNRIELFDGPHDLNEMESALWISFSGELDLALCNSVALATFLDLRRQNTVRHLHWPDLLSPLPQFLKVRKTLELMAAYGGGYIDTRLRVEEAE